MRRFYVLRKMLTQLGVEEDRVQLIWASASEGILLAEKVDQMTEALRALGPLSWDEKVINPSNGYKAAEVAPVLEEA